LRCIKARCYDFVPTAKEPTMHRLDPTIHSAAAGAGLARVSFLRGLMSALTPTPRP
jgi:hypothetical protein